tara:strand:+ start:2864 stop:3229 length:366 start_codon:yes stop_codon:yes gene_type:complete
MLIGRGFFRRSTFLKRKVCALAEQLRPAHETDTHTTMTRPAPTPHFFLLGLVVPVAIAVFVVAPLATDLMELVLKPSQQSLLQTARTLCILVLSAAWNLLVTLLFLWAPVVLCVAVLVVCF